MDLKKSYFSERNDTLSRNTSDRSALAIREIDTLKIILKLINYDGDINFEGKVFCDLGCGDQYLKPIIESLGATYIGLDIDRCNFETDAFPVDDSSIDFFLSYSLIEHLYNPSKLISEIKRCSKSGAYVLFECPNWKYCQADFYDDFTHVHPYTPTSLVNLLKMTGVDVLLDSPNLRCKPDLFYTLPFRYFLARILPFTGSNKWVPSILKGRAKGIFVIGRCY